MCFLTHTKVCVYIENTREFDVAGEHGEWCKHTNFELATHAPMMVHIPGKTDSGVVSEELTEYVGLFPTLVDLFGQGADAESLANLVAEGLRARPSA